MFKSLPVAAAAAIVFMQQPDPPQQAGQIAVGVLICIYVLEKVIPLITQLMRKNGDGKPKDDHSLLAQIAGQVDDLHEWHKGRDASGAFLWYKSADSARMVDLLEEIRDLTRDVARRG